ncbi:nesprin-2-like isoform X2 [Cimex lectularius]|uniref:KASH domain-containing protein n=1 Tax=Cimex lectularius TaxID=79782 RepID=A0A8I6SM76_CIMLE|nr:nesprin-2-like isoform X2 [Cimex lectularius]
MAEWKDRNDKVEELRRLADAISKEVGIEVLRPEVDSLAKRLQDAQLSLKAIDAADKIKQPVILEDIKKTLKSVEAEKEPTKQLTALRDHLVLLSKTEDQIVDLGNEPYRTDSLSVMQLLQLWEKIFRETFQEYHRLSSRLINTEESANVLTLWEDYLHHVNQFLDSSLPQHYHELSDQNKLCQVHHDVISCQKSLIPSHKANADKSVIEQFNRLTNVHNETLARIMDKQTEIQGRLISWEKYRQEQNLLLNWLKDAETDRNKLKLRYVHAKSLGKTIAAIQVMLKRFHEGEEMEKSLHKKLNMIMKVCDDSLANSLKYEHSSISNRMSNLQAALRTWKDSLMRVKENYDTYESQVNKIQYKFKDIQNHLSNETHESQQFIPYEKLEHRLAKIEEVSREVDALGGDISYLEELKDVLKDTLSPNDIKLMSQRCWLFSQQQSDLEHQLSFVRQTLEDQIQLAHLYDKRFERFLNWAKGVDERLDRMSSHRFMDAGQALRRLETEIQSEVSIKKKEVDWLSTTGRELLSVEDEGTPHGKRLTQSLETLTKTWKNILANTDGRAAKLRTVIQHMAELEVKMEHLRTWLQNMEHKLSLPFTFTSSSSDNFEKLLKEQEELQTEIEQHSSEIGEVLNLCELLLNDCELCHIVLDTEGITMAMNNIERRWSIICVLSNERRSSIESLWAKIQNIFVMVDERQTWMDNMAKEVTVLENHLTPPLCNVENISQTNQNLKAVESDIKSLNSEGLKLLDETYRILLRKYSLPNDIIGLPEKLQTAEENLLSRVQGAEKTADSRAKSYEKFLKAQERAVTAMVKCDAMLTMAEVKEMAEINTPEALVNHLDEIEKILREENDNMREADELGLKVMKWCPDKDINKIKHMMDEYQSIWKDVKLRLAAIRDSNILPVKMTDQSVEVSTLKFETDRSTQVDTLGWNDSPISRKDAFITNLQTSIEDMEQILSKLAKLDDFETYQKIGNCISQCDSTFDYVKHLSELLLEQYDANETEAQVEKIKSINDRFKALRQQAQLKLNQLKETSAHGKLSCPLCSNNNWKQLDNDLWRLEQWLQCAEGRLSSQPSTPPTSMEQLEDVIQDQRELLLDLDSHRNLVVSMNIVGTHLAEHSDSEERARDLRTRLANDNLRWDRVCESAASWQAKLQTALIQNGEFHDTIAELTAWLERTEVSINQSEPINLNDPANLIQAKLEKFRELKQELERCEPRIISLEETARQVMTEETKLACQKLHRMRLRLQSLTRLTALYLARLAGAQPPTSQQPSESSDQGDQVDIGEEVETRTLVRCHNFLGRVMRASVPISAFLLLLLGAATLIPQSQPDFACAESILYNWAPILRYPYGHPPI